MVSNKQESNTFNFMPDIDPEWTRIQRIQGVVSDRSMSFESLRPIPRALLSSRAYIKWTYEIEMGEGLPGNILVSNFLENDEQLMYMKPFMLLANCTNSLTLSLNGYGMTYREPKYWSKYIGLTQAKMAHYKSLFGSAGAPIPTFSGAYNFAYLNTNEAGQNPGSERQDVNISIASDMAFENYKDVVEEGVIPGGPIATFSFTEPLYFGPFNPFFSVNQELRNDSWYKRLSNTIPYVHQLQLDINLGNIEAGTTQFGFRARIGPAAGNISALINGRVLSSELVLEWVVPKPSLILQPKIDIPSWEIDTKFFAINDGNVLNDTILGRADGNTTQITTDFIHYRQIPSFILIAGVRDKDVPEYRCESIVNSDNLDGTVNQVFRFDTCSWEPSLQFDNITLTVDVNNRFIDNRFNTQELFLLTSKNCKDLPFNFQTFIGGNRQYSVQPGNSFIFLKPDDISIKQSTGRRRNDFTLQIDSTLRTRTGFSIGATTGVGATADTTGNYVYKLMVCTIYNQNFITLGKDRKVEKRTVSQFI